MENPRPPREPRASHTLPNLTANPTRRPKPDTQCRFVYARGLEVTRCFDGLLPGIHTFCREYIRECLYLEWGEPAYPHCPVYREEVFSLTDFTSHKDFSLIRGPSIPYSSTARRSIRHSGFPSPLNEEPRRTQRRTCRLSGPPDLPLGNTPSPPSGQ